MSDEAWRVSDDAVSYGNGRKELAVCGPRVGILIEYAGYTGEFTAAGRKLATRIAKLLNEADAHCRRVYAGQDGNGYPLDGLPLTKARQRARAAGFKGAEAEEIARAITGRKS